MVLWLITGTAFLTYFGAKAHRCLHPRHVGMHEFTWAPSEVPTLELGLVAGSISVRSCPYAKNVSLTVRTYASTPELLNTMVLERVPLTETHGQRLVLSAPSFDWAHCQRAAMEVVVPEGAQIDVKAQGIMAHFDIRADKQALRHVVLSATAASIEVHRSKLSGALRLDAEIAHAHVRDVSASQGLVADVRVGYVDIRNLDATDAPVSTTVRIGKASLSHVTAQSVIHQSELAMVSGWDIDAAAVTARVDTGSLSLASPAGFSGSFAVRSPYGFVNLRHGDQVTGLVKTKENLAAIEGSVKTPVNLPATSNVIVAEKMRTVTLDALYGSVDLFVPNPETAYERSHH